MAWRVPGRSASFCSRLDAPRDRRRAPRRRLPQSRPPRMMSFFSQLTDVMDIVAMLAVPFPSEPVGVGARWRHRTISRWAGMQRDLVTTYELAERRDDRLQLTARIEGWLYPKQRPEVREAFSGSGKGTLDPKDPLAMNEGPAPQPRRSVVCRSKPLTFVPR